MIIYLGRPLPDGSSDPPESTTGSRIAFFSVLLRMEFTCARSVTTTAVVSYTAFPPLPSRGKAVYFCCTGLGVASTGRYPASCPVKPGLSSSAPFRLYSRDHLSWLRKCYSSMVSPPSKAVFQTPCFQTSKQLPPTNSLSMELWGTSSLGTATK